MGPIEAEAIGIEIEVTCGGARDAINRATHVTSCVRHGDIETDMVAMGAEALWVPEIRPDLEAGKSAIEVRRCPLCEVLLGLLAEYTTP